MVSLELLALFQAKGSAVVKPLFSLLFCLSVDFEGTFGVDTVGDIPPGLPTPKFPRLDKMSSLAEVEDYAGIALVASIISFIITHSIAKSLAGATEVRAMRDGGGECCEGWFYTEAARDVVDVV